MVLLMVHGWFIQLLLQWLGKQREQRIAWIVDF